MIELIFRGVTLFFVIVFFIKSSTKRTFTKIGILIILKKELRKFWNQSNNIKIVDNYKRKRLEFFLELLAFSINAIKIIEKIKTSILL